MVANLLRWLFVLGLVVLLGGCSQVRFAYIQVFPPPNMAVKGVFVELDRTVRTWPEFGIDLECQEDSDHAMNRFRSINDRSIFVATILNAQTGTLVLAFAQYGARAFTPDAQNLLGELANRVKSKFGEDRVALKIDQGSGKDLLEQSIKGDRGRFPLCAG